MDLEQAILKSLTVNEEFLRKATPYLKRDYFKDLAAQAVYLIADDYFRKYNVPATEDVLRIELDKTSGLNESLYKQATYLVGQLAEVKVDGDTQWLINQTEQWCQDRALYNGIMTAISVFNGDVDPKVKERDRVTKNMIPDLLRNALAVSFDSRLGHDYVSDADAQFDFYTSTTTKIPFAIDILNEITDGGIMPKTLNIVVGGTHGGKTLTMCDWAASHYQMGYNVLYITLEEEERKIRQRIDANLMGVDMGELKNMSRAVYLERIKRIRERTTSRLKVREYPTSGAGVAQFRYLLNEYRIKENFVPDIIYIDYLNICCSNRQGLSAGDLYIYNKSIAEELRGFAQEMGVPIVTGTQLNRSGFSDSDPGMDQVSDSFGVAFTADFMVALIGNEKLDAQGLIMWKQQKNRYKDKGYKLRFVTGCDKPKMRLYDVDQTMQPPPSIDEEGPSSGRLKSSASKSDRFKGFQA